MMRSQPLQMFVLALVGLYAVLTAALLMAARPGSDALGVMAIALSLAVWGQVLRKRDRRNMNPRYLNVSGQLRRRLAAIFGGRSAGSDVEPPRADGLGKAEPGSDPVEQLVCRALRCLNNPTALARAELGDRIPMTLDAATRETFGRAATDATPLERAQAIRTVFLDAIERLRLPEIGSRRVGGDLQYHILHEEYVLGRLNKHIMVRHDISEGTFNRNRRQAIAVLSEDLCSQELLIAKRSAIRGGTEADRRDQQPNKSLEG